MPSLEVVVEVRSTEMSETMSLFSSPNPTEESGSRQIIIVQGDVFNYMVGYRGI